MIDAELRGPRARAQLLHRPDGVDVTGAVRRLLAVQAQDLAAFPLALRARVAGITAADVDAAIDDRSVVRTWGPRGTLHLIAAEDLPWLFALMRTSGAGQAGSARRLRELGVTADLDDCVDAVDRALAGRGPLTKAELGGRLAEAGLPAEGQAIVHLAGLAAREGLAVLGPARAGKPTYVHTGDWLGAPIPTSGADRSDALARLARRYVRAHAAAGPRDLAAWSGLALRDVMTGWETVTEEAASPDAGDVPVRLLPGYDEYLLGWASRDFAVPERHRRVVHPGGGILRPVVIVAGEVVATWRSRRAGKRLTITVEAFAPPLTSEVVAAVEEETADLARFLGYPDFGLGGPNVSHDVT